MRIAGHLKESGVDIYMRHKTTYDEKMDKTWYEPMIDYYIDLGKMLNDKGVTKDNIDAAKSIIKSDVMKEVLDQINDKNMKVEIKELNILDDVDIITPIKERYMGEFVRTPNFYTATVQGADITLALKAKVQEKIYAIFMAKLKVQLQEMQDELSKGGMKPEEIEQEMAKLNIKEEVEKIKEEFFTKEAAKAKQIVEFFVSDSRFEEDLQQLFYYFFATEECYVKFEPQVNVLNIETIHPVDYYRIPKENSIFTEEDEAGFIRHRMTIRDILDEFGNYLTEDDVSYLEGLLGRNITGRVDISAKQIYDRYIEYPSMANSIKGKLGTNKESIFANDVNSVDVYELYIKTKRKVGILTYLDLQGQLQTRNVGDTYEIDLENGDVSIEWEWEDEVWKGYRFGNGYGAGVYIPLRPISVQRNELSVKNSCKIPIVGIGSLLYDFARKPVPARMISHQALYVILTNKYRKELAKFHGFINLIAESILSDSDEFTQEARLEYMYKDNLLIFNDSEVDVNTLQSLRTIGNTGQADYIRAIDEMRKGVKAEAWDLANMNAERFGQIDTKGGMSNTQEAIRRVSTGSVLLFTMFDMLKERLYQAISDYGRIVYVDGIQTDFMNANKEIIELDVNHEELISSEIGIHFTVNILEKEKIDSIRNAIVSTNVQSGNTLDAINALNEDDLSSLKVHAAKLQKIKEAREEQLAKQEQEVKKYIEDKKNQLEEMKLKGSLDEVDLKGRYGLLEKDKDVYIKMLELQAQRELAEAGYDSNGNGVIDHKDDNSEFDANLKYLETQIKEQQLELTRAKVKNEKQKPKPTTSK